MHEASLVRQLLDQVRRLADAERAQMVDCVEIELGPLSGVEAELVASAFRDQRAEFGWRQTELVIQEVPLIAECPDCGSRFEIVAFDFSCPRGCAARVRVVQGDGCILKRVALQVADESSEESGGPT